MGQSGRPEVGWSCVHSGQRKRRTSLCCCCPPLSRPRESPPTPVPKAGLPVRPPQSQVMTMNLPTTKEQLNTSTPTIYYTACLQMTTYVHLIYNFIFLANSNFPHIFQQRHNPLHPWQLVEQVKYIQCVHSCVGSLKIKLHSRFLICIIT